MTNANARMGSEATVSDLVMALNDLRDALVNASLRLQDIQFDLDTGLRMAATEYSQALIETFKARV